MCIDSLSALLSLFILGCGPIEGQAIVAERLSTIDDPSWSVSDFSISPDGKWAAVALVSEEKPRFRLVLLDLYSGRASEALPDWVARGQLLANDRPGARALEWESGGQALRFPAGIVGAGYVMPNHQGGEAQRVPGVATGSRAWFMVAIEDNNVGALKLDDSREALDTIAQPPENVDSRLGIHTLSKEQFALLDVENGSREIATFQEAPMLISLETAVLSEDGTWIGVTVTREAFGSHGPRGIVLSRDGSQRFDLGDQIYGPLRFHPSGREVFGISRAFSHGRADLARWRF